MIVQRYLSQLKFLLRYLGLGVDFSIPLQGSGSSHGQSHLNIRCQFIICIWWRLDDFGPTCQTGTDVVIIGCVIGIGALEPDCGKPVWIASQ